MAGETTVVDTPRRRALRQPFRKRPGRTEFQRAVMERSPEGELLVHSTGMQGSGILRSMSRANCFVVLPEEAETVEPGAMVEIELFSGFSASKRKANRSILPGAWAGSPAWRRLPVTACGRHDVR
jgi:molybdopterin molybdotransferase